MQRLARLCFVLRQLALARDPPRPMNADECRWPGCLIPLLFPCCPRRQTPQEMLQRESSAAFRYHLVRFRR
ncbi:hypothetical protein Hsero_3748 [Herbaspirillum seropedicae SmR1]|uniref:Uncharacterized protein n=1 Tax=Herbaspirillum seropedicae (strain SmR1) TaxID=757424 RepID=D8IRA0_HERSS|nr:hypothetical protein Hsero_3748 [Herbaspirillum seropedicae SmR1]